MAKERRNLDNVSMEKERLRVGNEEYLPFDCISGIYLGVNFSQSSKEYKKLISVAAKYDWLPIYQGKLSLNRYEIEFEEDYSSNMQVYLKKNKQS